MNIIGIDIGGSKSAVVKLQQDGSIATFGRFATKGVDQTLEQIFYLIENLNLQTDTIFGISCGGPLDSQAGIIQSPPNLPGWNNIEIVKMIEKRFGGKAHLMNDANAGALAEWRWGNAKGGRNIAFLTHGTGIGAGLVLNGQLYEGTTGDAGEIGHVRLTQSGPQGYGKSGSVEGYCSGSGIARLAQMRLKGRRKSLNSKPLDEITAFDVATAAQEGDSEAVSIMSESGRNLGRALAIFIDVLNLEVIVLGSIYTKAGNLLQTAMMDVLKEEALSRSFQACRVVPLGLEDEIGNYAAIAVALYNEGHLFDEYGD